MIELDAKLLRDVCLTADDYYVQPDSYSYIDNGSKVLGVAHVDTVSYIPPTFDYGVDDQLNWLMFSHLLDDRLGVYTLLHVLPKHGVNCDILLTTNEEHIASTASQFRPKKRYNWMFELDRMGTGAVYYQYHATQLPYAMSPFIHTERGTYSDIRALDHLHCAGVNVGIGYYNEHWEDCYMNVAHWKQQVQEFIHFYHAYKNTRFVYPFTKMNRIRARLGLY